MKKRTSKRPARERQLTDFAPAVYLEFIRNNMLLFRRDILGEFIEIEARLEYEEIRKKVDQIIERKVAPIPPAISREELLQRLKQTAKDSAMLDALWARQDELSAIMFPDTRPEAIEARRRESK